MIDLRGGLSSALNIRPGEGVALGLLFVTAFFKGTSIVFFDTVASAKFLTDYSYELLPEVYIATAVVSVVLGLVYTRCERVTEPLTLMKFVLVFLITMMFGFYALLLLIDAAWLSLALMVWKDVHWVLIEIEFWAVASFLFNVRQGKRLFGLVVCGQILATVLGGFGMPWIVDLTGTVHLLLIAAIGLSLCLVMLFVIQNTMGHRFVFDEDDEEASRKSLLELCRDRYLRLFFIISFLSMISYYLLEYIFYAQVESVFMDETALAGFFGVFFAVLSLVNLVTGGLVTSRLLGRFGILAGLAAVPLVASIGVLAALAVSATLAVVGGFLWILIGTKLLHEVGTDSIESPTFRVLYLPLPPGERLRAQAVRESMIEPVSLALAGLLLIVLAELWHFDNIELSYVFLGLAGATIFVAVLLRREYVRELISKVRKRRWTSGDLALEDASSLRVLKNGLGSDYPAEVIFSLRLLEDGDHPSIDESLITALSHSAMEVRKHALERIEARQLETAADGVSAMLETESDIDMRGLAIRVFCALREGQALELAPPLMAATERPIRKGAMVGLLRSGGLEGVLLAGSRLNELLQSADPDQRKLAADVIGDVGISAFHRPLLPLLGDKSSDVQHAALSAAAELKNAKLAAPVIDCLQDPTLREVAIKALISFGPTALGALTEQFDKQAVGDANRLRLIHIMGRMHGAEPTRQLLGYLELPDLAVRHTVLTELAANNHQAGKEHSAAIEDLVLHEVSSAVWALSACQEIRTVEGMDLLTDALERDVRTTCERVLLLLSLLFTPTAILDAREKLFSDHPDMRANGLEVIDNLVGRNLKAAILPLFDDIPDRTRLARLKDRFSNTSRDETFGQRACMTNQALLPWTRACAVYLAGTRADLELLNDVHEATGDPDWLVRETAAWTLLSLAPQSLSSVAERLDNDPSAAVRDLVARWRRDTDQVTSTASQERTAGGPEGSK